MSLSPQKLLALALEFNVTPDHCWSCDEDQRPLDPPILEESGSISWRCPSCHRVMVLEPTEIWRQAMEENGERVRTRDDRRPLLPGLWFNLLRELQAEVDLRLATLRIAERARRIHVAAAISCGLTVTEIGNLLNLDIITVRSLESLTLSTDDERQEVYDVVRFNREKVLEFSEEIGVGHA